VASLGLEYQRTNFSANINKYHILSGKKVVNAAKEAAWSGYDVKFSGQAPYQVNRSTTTVVTFTPSVRSDTTLKES
jgi:biotin synthase-like enzyme